MIFQNPTSHLDPVMRTGGYGVGAGDQIASLIQQQLANAGVTVTLQKVDLSRTWDVLVNGGYDLNVNYWTNDILDSDRKTTFVLGHDVNMNDMTRYKNDTVKNLVAATRLEMDPAKRGAIQKLAKADLRWIDLSYSPFISVTNKGGQNFGQNPLGRFWLEETVKTYRTFRGGPWLDRRFFNMPTGDLP